MLEVESQGMCPSQRGGKMGDKEKVGQTADNPQGGLTLPDGHS